MAVLGNESINQFETFSPPVSVKKIGVFESLFHNKMHMDIVYCLCVKPFTFLDSCIQKDFLKFSQQACTLCTL